MDFELRVWWGGFGLCRRRKNMRSSFCEMVDESLNDWLTPTGSVSPVTPYYVTPPTILRRSRIFLHDG